MDQGDGEPCSTSQNVSFLGRTGFQQNQPRVVAFCFSHVPPVSGGKSWGTRQQDDADRALLWKLQFRAIEATSVGMGAHAQPPILPPRL